MKLVPTTAAALIAGLMAAPLTLPVLAQTDPQSQSPRMDRPEDPGRTDRPPQPDRQDQPDRQNQHDRQNQPDRQNQRDRQNQHDRQDWREQRPDRGRIGALLRLNCRPNSAERLEIALVRASYRLELTEAQQPLFEELRSAALAAQASFTDVCEAAQPQHDAAPSLLERLQSRIAIDSARIEAWNAMLPALTALYDSLDETQKGMLDQGGSRRNRDVAPETPPEPPLVPDAPAPTEEPAPPAGPTQS